MVSVDVRTREISRVGTGGSGELSPDGTTFAYTGNTKPQDDDQSNADVWIRLLDGGEAQLQLRLLSIAPMKRLRSLTVVSWMVLSSVVDSLVNRALGSPYDPATYKLPARSPMRCSPKRAQASRY